MLKLKNAQYIYRSDQKMSKQNAIELEPLKEGEKISLISDSMFKTMFQNESRIKYSCFLISELFMVSYETLLKELKLNTNEIKKEKEIERVRRCDYVASIGETIVNIELNNNKDLECSERNREYAFRLFNQDQKNNKKRNQIIQINLNNYSIIGDDSTIKPFLIMSKDKKLLTDNLIFVEIYLPNIKKKMYTNGIGSLTNLEKYVLALVEPNNKLSSKIGKGMDIVEEYINEATEACSNELLQESYDKEQALKDMYKEEGMEQGIEQGKKMNSDMIIKNMLKDNMDIELISKYTNIPVEKIKAYIEEKKD